MILLAVRLHPILLQVARAGRFGTKGLAITFVSDETDAKVLNTVQERFEVNISELPDEIDSATYSELPFGVVYRFWLVSVLFVARLVKCVFLRMCV